MPKRTSRPPLLTTLHREAAQTLAVLHKEISRREHELAVLKTTATRWQAVLQAPAGKAPPTASLARDRSAKRSRLDWSAVFHDLPPRFTTQAVAQKAGKPLAQVYTHLSGWMKAKKLRRVKDGYQKVAQAV